jgi:hypothetical protein
MKQKFSKKLQKRFLEYFKAKDKPWKIEKTFYEKTYKYVNIIKKFPWLQMIAVWNSISMNSATKNSDIDLFIVTSQNSLWFTRIFITFVFSILWVRKTAKKHAWRFCLSFFVTHRWLDFSNWKLENDIYLYFRIIYLKPILNYNNTYEEFLKINSKWADFSEYEDVIKKNKEFIKIKDKRQKIKGNMIWVLNSLFKRLFLSRTLKHYEKIWKPFWVIINDNMLKFHNWDIREKVKKEILN